MLTFFFAYELLLTLVDNALEPQFTVLPELMEGVYRLFFSTLRMDEAHVFTPGYVIKVVVDPAELGEQGVRFLTALQEGRVEEILVPDRSAQEEILFAQMFGRQSFSSQ